MTLGTALLIYNELNTLANKEMNVLTAYKVNKVLKAIEPERQSYIAAFNIIVNKYGEKDENGQLITTEDGGVKLKCGDEANKELSQLLSEPVNLQIGTLFRLSDFKDIEVSPSFISGISELMDEEEE